MACAVGCGCAEKRTKLRQALTRPDKDHTIGFSPRVQEWNGQVGARRGEEFGRSVNPVCTTVQSVRCFTSHSRIKPIQKWDTRTRDPLKRVAGVSTRWPTIATTGRRVAGSERKCVRACRASVSTCRDFAPSPSSSEYRGRQLLCT